MSAPKKMNVLDDIAAFVDTRKRGPEMKIHVGEKAVLGVMCPNGDRSGVALFNLDVKISQRLNKRSRDWHPAPGLHRADACRRKKT